MQRLRFEHPEVRAVVVTSGKEKIFCAGANIRMLAASPHAWKVNFCKFTNETRNALRDLIEAVGPDGVPVSDPGMLLADRRTASEVVSSAQLAAALEATRRLRATAGEAVALVAVIPGPASIAARTAATGTAAADTVTSLGKEFLAAGADLIIVEDETEMPGTTLTTLANIARFHQAAALSHGTERYGLPATVPVELHGPHPVPGVVLTPGPLARDTDISVLRDWVEAVRN